MSGQVAADSGCHRLLGVVNHAQHAPSGAKREGAAHAERGAPSLPGVEGQAFSLRRRRAQNPLNEKCMDWTINYWKEETCSRRGQRRTLKLKNTTSMRKPLVGPVC
ncbi:MAG: hypothetical protein H7A03_09945 [Pseudomonadales bacterium]|nr:hypothetical protein [Pseudomonadales bacterium]